MNKWTHHCHHPLVLLCRCQLVLSENFPIESNKIKLTGHCFKCCDYNTTMSCDG